MKTITLLLALFVIIALPASGQNPLAVGDKAPLFKAKTDSSTEWDLKRHLGKKYIVVYFYPAAMTGGCTKQACSYRDRREDLAAAGVEVVGISGDNPDGLKLFREAENLNFTLLSDPDGSIVPVSDGGAIKRTVAGLEHELKRGVTAKRWTFVIGKDKKIIYRNDAVNAEKDTGEVLAFIKAQKQ
jgi:peroxiredoxin Q/BCP